MNESTRKALTDTKKDALINYLGETHSFRRRDFNTPDDADALRRKMDEKGDWEEFIQSIYGRYPHSIIKVGLGKFAYYLMENFNELCGQWIEEKNNGRYL
jgi:DNA polymerase III delta prime subunit